ncbi:MAG: UDP-N-acetylglucosamine 2-epimerase [Gammaproteobacteria bacterium RIFCSPHIGHO2_12_FULL_38_14]|nr:MAG: UDP-N-acetylglucosamine 2-epimerase [Gammaproteobacteria bacterium RIFCSPHIGHO2_12_FULL_38_14]
MTIVGTRPEIIRLSEVIKKADQCFDHTLVHTGQNYDYELNQVFFDDLDLRAPDIFMDAAGQNLGETIGNIITKSFQVISKNQPDALLILGDTNSCLAAYAAKRLKVPIFHMEAGNRCFDQNVPEEINRKIVDHISDINMSYTENSRHYLLSEGFRKEHIFVTGSPMREVIEKQKDKINRSDVLKRLGLSPSNYLVLSAHREENIDNDKQFLALIDAINHIAEKIDKKIIFSMHPRTRKRMDAQHIILHDNIEALKPLGFIDYNALQKHAYVVISDSGTLSEETAMLNFPGVLLRTSTERPEAIDNGSMIIAGIEKNELLQSIFLVRRWFEESRVYLLPRDYQSTNVSEKVVRIIQSYTKIVNQYVWLKSDLNATSAQCVNLKDYADA